MSHINHIEDENRYRNDLGRENRSAIKRSLLMALMAVGAITAAVLLAPASDPSPIPRTRWQALQPLSTKTVQPGALFHSGGTSPGPCGRAAAGRSTVSTTSPQAVRVRQ